MYDYAGGLFVVLNCFCFHSRIQDGNTALHFSAQCGHVEVVRCLLSHGANFSSANKVRLTESMTISPCYLCLCFYVCMFYVRIMLGSMDRRQLFFPQTRTMMAMSRSFAIIAPSLWNRLPPSTFSSCFSPIIQSFYVLITS